MARFAYGRHAAKVAIGTYPDDNSYPVGTNEWNEDINNLGMLGFTSVEGTCATNVVTLTGDAVANTGLSSVLRIDGQGDAADDLDGITIAQTNEYDLLYLFAENSGRAITVQHASGNVSTGKIYLLAGSGTKVLSTTTPMLVIRKGNDWYEYGGGAQTTPTDITVADESSDTTCFPLYVTAATGDLAPKSGSNLAFNSSSGILTATGFAGALTGAVTGNADTATSATTATNVTVADESSDASCNVLFATAATGNLPPKSGTNLTFNSSSGLLTATLFAGDLTGAVTGNADTATSATTATTATNVTVADESSDTSCNVLFTTAATGNLPPKSGTNLTFNSDTGVLSAVGLTLSGDLTVNGTTTTINSTVLEVADKLIEIAKVGSPSNSTADGGGILIEGGGDGDKTITWTSSTGDFDISENVDIATGKVFKVNGVSTLTATALGSAVVGSSLTSVGTLTGLTLSGALTGTDVALSGRLKTDKGADVASATATTLGADGNTFDITGTTTIVTIPSTNWAVGNIVHLQFDGVLTVTHSSATDSILLGNQANMTTAAGDVLSLFFNGTNWVEVSRSSVSSGGGMHEIQDFDLRTAGQITSYESSRTAGTDGYMFVREIDDENDGLFIKIKKNNTAWTEVQIA